MRQSELEHKENGRFPCGCSPGVIVPLEPPENPLWY